MERYLDEIIKTTQKLIAFNSIQTEPLENMPFGKANYDCLETCLDVCKNLGFTVKNLDGYAGYAEIGEGESFGILAHLDVVPSGDGWSVDPFSGEIIDGVLYGRGVLDDKGPIVCCIYAIKKLIDEGKMPNKKIRIIFGCNEESGWECIKHYNKVEKMPEIGFSPDADFPVIYLEKGIAHYKVSMPLDVVNIRGGLRVNMVPDSASLTIKYSEEYENYLKAQNAVYTTRNGLLTIETVGKSAHGSTPEQGENAVIKLFELSNIPSLISLAEKFKKTDGTNLNMALYDKESKNLSVNLGAVSYENGVIEMLVDIRYPASQKESVVTSLLQENLSGCTVELYSDQAPIHVDKNSILVKTLLSAYNKVTGENAEPIAIGGGTYARALKQGVAFGPIFPGQESTIHQKDERVKIDDLLKMSKIYYEAIKNLCFD